MLGIEVITKMRGDIYCLMGVTDLEINNCSWNEGKEIWNDRNECKEIWNEQKKQEDDPADFCFFLGLRVDKSTNALKIPKYQDLALPIGSVAT